MGISWKVRRRARNAWIAVWSAAFVVSLGGWVFTVFYSWYPLDHRNSSRWVVKVRDGAIEVKDYKYEGYARLISGRFGDRLHRNQPSSVFRYRHRLGIHWPRIYAISGNQHVDGAFETLQLLTRGVNSSHFIWSVIIPFWLPTTISFICLAPIIGRATSRRRMSDGHCSQCYYNLTGNESGICPECGTAIVPPSVITEVAG